MINPIGSVIDTLFLNTMKCVFEIKLVPVTRHMPSFDNKKKKKKRSVDIMAGLCWANANEQTL